LSDLIAQVIFLFAHWQYIWRLYTTGFEVQEILNLPFDRPSSLSLIDAFVKFSILFAFVVGLILILIASLKSSSKLFKV
jgi:hypothetical protein